MDSLALKYMLQDITDSLRAEPPAVRYHLAEQLRLLALAESSRLKQETVYALRCSGQGITRTAATLGIAQITVERMSDAHALAFPHLPRPRPVHHIDPAMVVRLPASESEEPDPTEAQDTP